MRADLPEGPDYAPPEANADMHYDEPGPAEGFVSTPEKPLSCVLLAGRHQGLAEAVRGLLETAFRSVVMVADETSLLEGAGRLRPDVAVVDLSLTQDRNLGWLRALRLRCPELKVIVLSVYDEQNVRFAAMEAGADAIVLKHEISTDLLPAVDRVRGGRTVGASTLEATPAGTGDD